MTNSSNKPGIGYYLKHNLLAKIIEIFLVFGAAILFILVMLPWAGDHIIKQMSVIWFANVIMILLVWLGNKLRGNNFG